MVSILLGMVFSGVIEWLQKNEKDELVFPAIIGGLIMSFKIFSKLMFNLVAFLFDFVFCLLYNLMLLITRQFVVSYRRYFPKNKQIDLT
jgi:hypothetical protein